MVQTALQIQVRDGETQLRPDEQLSAIFAACFVSCLSSNKRRFLFAKIAEKNGSKFVQIHRKSHETLDS